jgi:hypothetical protein
LAPLTKTFAALGLLVTLCSTSAFADTYRHIDELALDIQRQSRLLMRESSHYRHTPEYRHLLSDTRDIYKLAAHMHEVAHQHGSLAHLESDLRELDSEFHHLESVFDRVERESSHGHGHVHGYTGHVKELLKSIEADIHHLQEDVRSLRTHFHDRPVVSVSRPPVYVAPQSRHSSAYNSHRSGHQSRQGYPSGVGRGITFGGGSTRFSIRF